MILNETSDRIQYEGLNSVKYKIKKIIRKKLYTKYLVYYNETEILLPRYLLNTSVNSTTIKDHINS